MASKQKWKVYIFQDKFSQEVLKSAEVKAALNNIANDVVRAAGPGYKAKPYVGPLRAGVIVAPDTSEAYYDNLRNNTLLKSIRGV